MFAIVCAWGGGALATLGDAYHTCSRRISFGIDPGLLCTLTEEIAELFGDAKLARANAKIKHERNVKHERNAKHERNVKRERNVKHERNVKRERYLKCKRYLKH